jgi:hypothetical protein
MLRTTALRVFLSKDELLVTNVGNEFFDIIYCIQDIL